MLRTDFRNAIHELIAPDILTIEVSHALTRAERQSRIQVGQARVLFLDILPTPPQFFPIQPLLLRAIDISSQMRIGVYVALAEREACEFVTADARLVNALQKDFPFILSLDSMP
jgi:predicted nucleic acid-binding protein